VESNYRFISQRRKKLTIPWQCDLSILVYEHGSEISILVYEYGSQRSPSLSTSMGLRDLHPCLRAWISDLYPCLRAWRKDQRSPSLSTSMEEDLSRPSVFFLIEKIDPSESIFLKRSFDPLQRSSFAPCGPKKASYQESHASNRQIHRSRDDFIGI
jgi:hypothetical protein